MHFAEVYCTINLGDFMEKVFKYSLKLFLLLMFVSFASFMVAISFAVILSKSPLWVFYVFTQLFNFLILVSVVWQHIYSIGFKDSNMVKTGHLKKDIYKGFKIGAIAEIPFAIFLAVSVIANLKFSIYRIVNSQYFWFLSAIAGKSQNMQMGTLKIIAFVLLLFVVPIISCIIYILGYNGVDLFSKLVYKNRKE